MSEAVAELLERYRGLTDEERELFDSGVSVEAGDPMTDSDFLAELDRRVEAVGNGTAVLIEGDEAFRVIRTNLGRKRGDAAS